MSKKQLRDINHISFKNLCSVILFTHFPSFLFVFVLVFVFNLLVIQHSRKDHSNDIKVIAFPSATCISGDRWIVLFPHMLNRERCHPGEDDSPVFLVMASYLEKHRVDSQWDRDDIFYWLELTFPTGFVTLFRNCLI